MISLPTRRSGGGRKVLLAAAMVWGTAAAGVLGPGGVAHAATPDVFFSPASCTNVEAAAVYSPGLLTAKAKARQATLNGVISGCSVFQDTFSDTGTFSASLSGKASLDAENFGGTFTVTWPPSAGLNPSIGSLSVTDTNGTEAFSGTVTSGAFTQSAFSLDLVTLSRAGKGTRKSPVTSQLFTSTQPLTVTENVG